MRLIVLVATAFATIASGPLVRARFGPAINGDIANVFGGVCSKCLGSTVDPACQTGFLPACSPGNGFCTKYTFTGISVDYCQVAGAGQAGAEGCTTNTPQVCVRIKTCTGCAGNPPACTNCGAESTEDKPTKCNLIPYRPCTG